MNKRYLFVVGLPRSGTTGFAKLLNSNIEICLGVERYKYIKNKKLNFNESLFLKNKFFDLDDGYTNIKDKKLYHILEKKFYISKYIGDKIPNLYFELHEINKNFENPLFLCLVRNPINVAMSWEKRANNPLDKWPLENNRNRYIEYLIRFHDYYNLHINNKDLNIFFINFDILEGNYHKALNYYNKILNILELEMTPNVLKSFKIFHDKQLQLKLIRNEYHNFNISIKDKIFNKLNILNFDYNDFFKKISL